MKRSRARWRAVVGLAAILALPGGSVEAGPAGLALTSPAFDDGGTIPVRHGCARYGGDDVAVPLRWTGAPDATRAFAVIMDDPDAAAVAGYTWVHWNVLDLPATATGIVPGTAGGTPSANSWGTAGYGGPCPPSGRHTYVFAVYALDGQLGDPLPQPATRAWFEARYATHILAKGELRGVFP